VFVSSAFSSVADVAGLHHQLAWFWNDRKGLLAVLISATKTVLQLLIKAQ